MMQETVTSHLFSHTTTIVFLGMLISTCWILTTQKGFHAISVKEALKYLLWMQQH